MDLACAYHRAAILERALKRLEWDRVKEKQDKERRDAEEAEREAMLSGGVGEFS
jgi:hypothetical protein